VGTDTRAMTLRQFGLLLLVAVAIAVSLDAEGDLRADAAPGPKPCTPKRPCTGPTPPASVTATAAGATALAVAWSPATSPNGSITDYRLSVNNSQVADATGTTTTVGGLSCGTTYAVAVAAVDSTGAVSPSASTNGVTAACATTTPPPAPTPPSVWHPAPRTTWQWQITGAVDETVSAQMFDIDLTDAQPGEINAGIIGRLHNRGVRVICYMDSGAWESYRPDAAEFPKSVIGNSTGWNGEYWLDIRAQSWPLFEPIIVDRMKLAVASGCDGIEPDQNNPVGNNPGFRITYADEKAWYLEVAKDAHALGLSVGMKNGIEIVDSDLVSSFDWALNEECFQYSECDALTSFIAAGKAVFQVEYQGDSTSFCPTANTLGFSTMKKRLALDSWRITCW
jgi:hypothetical protein